MFQRIDAWIIGKFESACHKIQLLTGKTNFFITAVVHAILVFVIILIIPRIHGYPYIRVFLYLLIFFGLGYISHLWKYEEEQAFNRLAKGQANPLKLKYGDRLFDLIVFLGCVYSSSLLHILGLHSALVNLVLIAIGLSLTTRYLRACDPLPPCNSKIKDSLKHLLNRFSLPALIPAPGGAQKASGISAQRLLVWKFYLNSLQLIGHCFLIIYNCRYRWQQRNSVHFRWLL